MLKRISKRIAVPNLITDGITLYFIFRPLFLIYVLVILRSGIYDVINILVKKSQR